LRAPFLIAAAPRQAPELGYDRVDQDLLAGRNFRETAPGLPEEVGGLRRRGQPVPVPDLVGDLEPDCSRDRGQLPEPGDRSVEGGRPVEPALDQVGLPPDRDAAVVQRGGERDVRAGRAGRRRSR
jgi:hypothetical protein